MTIYEAYDYLKPFHSNYSKIKVKLDNGYFIVFLDENYYIINAKDPITSIIISKKKFNKIKEDINFIEMSKNKFIDDFSDKLFFHTTIYVFLEAYNGRVYYIPDNVAITHKKEFISEDIFYLASDILDESPFLKKKNLIDNEVYIGVNKKEYIYYNEVRGWKDQLLELESGLLRHRKHIKLVEKVEK